MAIIKGERAGRKGDAEVSGEHGAGGTKPKDPTHVSEGNKRQNTRRPEKSRYKNADKTHRDQKKIKPSEGTRPATTVHATNAGKVLASGGLKVKEAQSSVTDPILFGLLEGRVGPEEYPHPDASLGFSSTFHREDWIKITGRSSEPVETEFMFGNHRVMTATALDGTSLYYHTEGGYFRLISWKTLSEHANDSPGGPRVERQPDYIQEYSGNARPIPLVTRSPLGNQGAGTVYGLPRAKMGPASYHGHGEFSKKRWDRYVSDQQTPVKTSYEVDKRPVLTVTAKDGTHLFYVQRDIKGEVRNELVSWDLLEKAPTKEDVWWRNGNDSYFSFHPDSLTTDRQVWRLSAHPDIDVSLVQKRARIGDEAAIVELANAATDNPSARKALKDLVGETWGGVWGDGIVSDVAKRVNAKLVDLVEKGGHPGALSVLIDAAEVGDRSATLSLIQLYDKNAPVQQALWGLGRSNPWATNFLTLKADGDPSLKKYLNHMDVETLVEGAGSTSPQVSRVSILALANLASLGNPKAQKTIQDHEIKGIPWAAEANVWWIRSVTGTWG